MANTPVDTSGVLNVRVAFHLSKVPSMDTDAFTLNLIELSFVEMRNTGACACVTEGSMIDAKTQRIVNRYFQRESTCPPSVSAQCDALSVPKGRRPRVRLARIVSRVSGNRVRYTGALLKPRHSERAMTSHDPDSSEDRPFLVRQRTKDRLHRCAQHYTDASHFAPPVGTGATECQISQRTKTHSSGAPLLEKR